MPGGRCLGSKDQLHTHRSWTGPGVPPCGQYSWRRHTHADEYSHQHSYLHAHRDRPMHTDTPTPTVTSTACPIQFTDVPNPSTFYAFIRCLACRNIVNGYSDGTFRPNNNVTRGQLSKIVSNSAGFNDPQTTQMFEDVPPRP